MSFNSGTRNPKNVVRLQRFPAQPGVALYIGVDDVLPLMPIFRWNEEDQHYTDATGDYDLCMSEDGTKFKFINRRPTEIIFAYRFVPANWLAKRLDK